MNRLLKHPNLNAQIIKAQAGKHKFPAYVRSVPSIQVPDPNAQGKAVLYDGDAAFDWLDDQTGKSSAATGEGLMDYDPLAMGGVFGGGAWADLDGNEAIPNLSMADYSDPNAGSIGIGNAPSQEDFNNKSDADKRFQMMQLQREKEDAMLMGGSNQPPLGAGPPPPM